MIDSRMTELAQAILEFGDTAAIPDIADELAEAVLAQAEAESKPMRYALISANAAATEQIAAYLPGNYEVIGRTPIRGTNTVQILIGGRDSHGWTLDDYVIPRLASGLYFAEEVGG